VNRLEKLDAVKEYVAMTKRKDDLEDELKQVNARLGELEEVACDYFTETGIQNMKIDDRQVYLRNDIFASVKDGPEAIDLLVSKGYGDKVKTTVHASSAKAIVRELCAEGGLESAPAWVQDVFNTYEKIRVIVRK